MKKHNWKTYAFWILITEAVGALSGWLTKKGTQIFNESIIQPPLSPPSIVFPIVWGILYALMGISAARIYMSPQSQARSKGLNLYIIQLAVNFLWSIIFFNMQAFGFAFPENFQIVGLIEVDVMIMLRHAHQHTQVPLDRAAIAAVAQYNYICHIFIPFCPIRRQRIA